MVMLEQAINYHSGSGAIWLHGHFGKMRNNIAELREQKGWSREQLAEEAKTSAVQIFRLEKGDRRLSDVWLVRLAEAFGCRPQDIIAEVTPQLSEHRPQQGYESPPPAIDFVRANTYDVRASSGHGAWNAEEYVVGSISYEKTWLRRAGCTDFTKLWNIINTGDSNEPVIMDSDRLLIDGSQVKWQDGRFYAIERDGELMIKKIQPTEDGRLRIISMNPQYPPYVLDKGEVRIVGKVIDMSRSMY